MHFRLNLASRIYLDRRSVRRWLLLIGGLLALLLAANLFFGVRHVRQLRLVDERLAEIDGKLTAQRGAAATAYTPESLSRVKVQIGAANALIDADQFRWTALLSRFEALLPEDVAVRSLQPDYRDRSLRVTAVARDTAAMSALLDALLKSADMQQAFLLSQSQAELPDGETVVQFSIVIREAF